MPLLLRRSIALSIALLKKYRSYGKFSSVIIMSAKGDTLIPSTAGQNISMIIRVLVTERAILSSLKGPYLTGYP